MAVVYTQSAMNTSVTARVSGSFTAADFLTIANAGVREVLTDIDLRSSIRNVALSPNLFDDIYQYTCPSDIKGDKIIDIAPQINRGRYDEWTLVTQEEFDRKKQDLRYDRYGDTIELEGTQWLGENLVSFSNDDLVRKILLSRPIDDNEVTLDRLDAVGDWAGFGDGENLTADADNYVKGSSCINWDINADGGTTAGISNGSVDTFDVSDYLTNGSIFVWAYISSVTNLTNFILRVGSDSSNYYYDTITTNNEGVSFYAGWNLLRFDFSGITETGTVDDDACDYIVLYMTKDATKVSETDYRFDNIVMKVGEHYNVIYYSRHFWQSSAGSYLENATATTDYINCEADEVEIILEKIAEKMEEHLKNYNQADRHRNRYEQLKEKYIFDNISKSMMLVQSYYEI